MKELTEMDLANNRIRNVMESKPRTAEVRRTSNLPNRTTAPSISHKKN